MLSIRFHYNVLTLLKEMLFERIYSMCRAVTALQILLPVVCFSVLCICRRDSSMVKEEIKAFLGNRRISQAVVAQVTGEWTHSKTTLMCAGCQPARNACLYFTDLHFTVLTVALKYKTTRWECPAVFLWVVWDTGDLKRTEPLREESSSPSDIPLLSLENSSKGSLQIVLGLVAKHCCNSKSCCFPGISQSRISHWLLQHGSDLSEQKKRAFYRWYTLEKTTPGTSFYTLIVLTKNTLCVSISFISLAFLSWQCFKK